MIFFFLFCSFQNVSLFDMEDKKYALPRAADVCLRCAIFRI